VIALARPANCERERTESAARFETIALFTYASPGT
jgi:hypothetical protein